MREMKDSGVPWIGEIPRDWAVSQLKFCVSCFDGKRVPVDASLRKKGPYPYWGAGSITDWVDSYLFDEELVLLGEDGAPFFDSFRPVAHLINEKVWVNNHIHVLKVIPTMDSRFLVYWLNSVDYHDYINGSILSKLTQSKMNTIRVIIPPQVVQQRIANFLDAKCAEIDAVMEKTLASIEEYKKLKQAVITEAVTKGIRGDRQMKDSGVEWIGKIPKDWSIMKFGRCANVKSNLVDPKQYLDYPQVAPDCIEKGSARLIGPIRTVREANVISWNHLFFKGQIVYSKIRPLLNKLYIASFDGLCSADMYPIETSQEARFVMYLMLSSYFLEQIKQVTEDRVKMPKVNQEELSAFVVVLPMRREQQEIVTYLDEKCAAIDSLIASKEALITELEAYKKSIIYEYVTGKKEVL